MAKIESLPKSLAVRISGDGDEQYFIAETDAHLHAEQIMMGEVFAVGIYQLVDTKTVSVVASIK